MENFVIRSYAKERGVKLWEIAEAFGISDANLSRKLRHEWPYEEQKKACQMIDQIASAKGEHRCAE